MRFRRPELLREAMTRASWSNERGGPSGPGHDNERLEYLGDAVLELVVGEYLFRRFPEYDEGQLTQLRAALVNTISLARLAKQLQLGDALMLGKGAAKTGANRLPSLLANAFEALIGAIFLDHGYRVATRVFIQNIGDLADWSDENFKGRLQEVSQERTGTTPIYRVTAVGGPGHRRQYRAEALVAGEVVGNGTAATKQAAEQAAAQEALRRFAGRRRPRAGAVAAEAAGAALRAAEGAASESPRARRRIAEAAAEVGAAAVRPQDGRGRRAPAPAPSPSGGAAGASVPPAPAGVPPRRRGLLGALARAAEALVGRPLTGSEVAAVADSVAPLASAAPAPPATPAAGNGEAAQRRSGSRRGRRGGRGRRRPSGATAGGQPVEGVSAPPPPVATAESGAPVSAPARRSRSKGRSSRPRGSAPASGAGEGTST